jgi:hypothetical protein
MLDVWPDAGGTLAGRQETDVTDDGGDEAADLQRIDRVLRHASARSPLYQWMRKRHAKLADRLDGVRPQWSALAAEFGAMGLTDRTGKAPTGERARKTWWRVKADLAARATRPQGAAETAVQLLPPPPAAPPAPPAQAAGTTGPVGGFPPLEPEAEEPAVERPRFGFARLRGRGAPEDGSSKD